MSPEYSALVRARSNRDIWSVDGVRVVIQPLADYRVEVVSPSPAIRQLVAGDNSSSYLVQAPARVGGMSMSACPDCATHSFDTNGEADFDEWFLQGLYLVGETVPVTEYQSQEDRARVPTAAVSKPSRRVW
jgi:hypothetical protein